MKILQIGLGSMGKRRIRCLHSLGFRNIIGFDYREDRIKESEEEYGIQRIDHINKVNFKEVDCIIISVPPDKHLDYIKIAIDNNTPAFVEASVIFNHTKEAINYLGNNDTLIAPSCTKLFHPVIKDINEIVKSKKYGALTNFTYHTGQYLPDWHPWEDIKDFYVSNRETGGAREIVPFELTWITEVFGFPVESKGMFAKTFNLGVDIDDTYGIVMNFPNGIGTLTVDVVSMFATRSLIVNLEKAQIRWNWEDGFMKIFERDKNRWVIFNQPESRLSVGYNQNIIEDMYIEEINTFINSCLNNECYPNNLTNDYKVLQILDSVEQSDGGF